MWSMLKRWSFEIIICVIDLCCFCWLSISIFLLKFFNWFFSLRFSCSFVSIWSAIYKVWLKPVERRLQVECFPVNFTKFLKTTFFIGHLWKLVLYFTGSNFILHIFGSQIFFDGFMFLILFDVYVHFYFCIFLYQMVKSKNQSLPNIFLLWEISVCHLIVK